MHIEIYGYHSPMRTDTDFPRKYWCYGGNENNGKDNTNTTIATLQTWKTLYNTNEPTNSFRLYMFLNRQFNRSL